MPNIINLNIIYDSSGLLTGLNPIDLNCFGSSDNKKISSAVYDISVNPPLKISNPIDVNTKILTKIEDCDGSYYLVYDSYGSISDAMVSNCEFCAFEYGAGGTETLTTIQQPTLNGNILTIYYTGENGVQQTQSVDLSGIITNDINIEDASYNASTNIITITETDGTNHTIDLSEFSIIPTTNADGSISLVQEGVQKLLVKKVAVTGSYNDLTDQPTFTETDTLQSVVNRGNSSTKPIIFNADQGRAGELNFNKATYSYYFGNQNITATGFYNKSIGYAALSKLTTGGFNVVIGSYTGQELTTGNYNTFLGHQSAKNATTGCLNTVVGEEGAFSMTTGFKNTILGCAAAYQNTTGSLNTILGYKAGTGLGTNIGDKNIFIGTGAGQAVSGSNNILMGIGAGVNGAALSNKLIIHSNHTLSGYSNTAEGTMTTPQLSSLSNALVTGDFVDKWFKLNGSLVVNPSYIGDSTSLPAYSQIATYDPSTGYFGRKNLNSLDYIPLSGTSTDKPVTGDIELDNSSANRFIKGKAQGSYINFSDDGKIEINQESGSNVYIAGIDITGIDSNAKGIEGSFYYGTNYQDNSFVQKKWVAEKLAENKPYKVYTAIMSFGGSPITPNLVVFENTIGAIVWTRNGVGEYFGTLNGAFPISKVWNISKVNQVDGGTVKNCIAGRLDNDRIYIKLLDYEGILIDLLGEVGSIEFRVYN